MTYREAEEYLLGLELFGMRFGLDRMHKLMTVLGLPQRRFASIHVVGTNGKSSTARMIAAILERHGVRTGTYTSPHLRSFAERVEVSGQPVSEDEFAAAVERAQLAAAAVDRTLEEGDEVTQFEALTAAAFHALARAGVEVAVIEAGLGGRHDATNVIPSQVQVLTSVALDHTRWLGETVEEIAREKLAVVRDHSVLVTGWLPASVDEIASEVAAARHARRRRVTEAWAGPLRAAGDFQRRNFALAEAAAAEFLRESDIEGHIRPKVSKAAAETLQIPGRLEAIGDSPLTLIDGAHNPAGAQALAEALQGHDHVGVISILADKDAETLMRALEPILSRIVFTRSANPRAIDPRELRTSLPSEVVEDPKRALERARELAGENGRVLATGSIYLIADLLREHADLPASTL